MSARANQLKRVLLSTPLLGTVLALLTWPVGGVGPTAGLDPSWVAGLYMAGAQGMHAGTQIVFTYGPLGFLGLPNLFEIWPGRIAFFWCSVVQIALCTGLLWSSRRAFGLIPALLLTLFATSIPTTDPVLIATTVLCAAVLFGDWTLRSRLLFAVGIGALAGLQLLGSLRAGPTLVAMGFATLLGLPDRRRTFPTFFGATILSFAFFWLITGQSFSNLGEYIVNTAEVVSGYSAAMVFYEPDRWWQTPAFIVGLASIVGLCIAAVWRRDNMRRIGFVLMIGAVTFLMFKHAVVRESAGSTGVFMGVLLAISLTMAPYVRRTIAIVPIALLIAFAYISNYDHIGTTLNFQQKAENYRHQFSEMAIPGRAEKAQQLGRETMQATYKLTPAELAVLRSGTVHVAPWEAGVVWAYELDWDPLPVFQQYSAYTARLDELNAAKLESPTAPDHILWENTTIYDPNSVNYPGAIDYRWPAFESPAQMDQMFCRYRAVSWSEAWAILRHSADRCGRARPIATVEIANGESVPLPPTRPNEALFVRVEGLAVDGVEKLRTLLLHAQNRHVIFQSNLWNVVGDTAADGLLLQVPRGFDYPGKFALSSGSPTVGFERIGGFMTGVDSSTKLTLHFYAIPLDRSGIVPRAGAAQKRRVQRSIR